MHSDVVAECPLEYPPVLEAAVEGLVVQPCRRLHLEILGTIAAIVGALDLVRVPHVAIVGLNALARQEVAREGVPEDLEVRPGTGGVGPLHPDKISLEDIYAELVLER